MSDRTKIKKAYIEAIAGAMWLKGLLTQQERERIAKESCKKLRRGNC